MIHLRLIHAACWGAVLSCFGSPLARGDEPNAPAAQPPAPVAPAVQTFLGKYCTGCHGEKQAKGERRFHQLPQSIASDDSLVDFQGILDQLNLGEMPPPKAAQPTAQQRRQVIAAVTKAIAGYRATRKPVKGETVLRRLNAREYRHTIRDLFRLNTVIFDPTQTFPRDQTAAHLDNVGDELVTSGYLLQQYLSAAEQVVDRAVYPLEPPPIEKWSFRNGFRQQPEIDQVHRHTNRFEHMTLYEVRGADKHEGAYGHIREFAKGVPYDGFYTIRFHAEALNREHPYDPQFLGTDPSEPLRLGIVAGHQRVGQLHKPQPIEPLLEELELADEAKWYTTRVWLDAGYTPRFTYENGTMEMRSLYARILRKHPKLFPKPSRRGIVANRYTVLKFGKLPQIRIYEFEIEGPFYDRWPRASQRAVFGDNWEVVQETGELPDDRVRAQLSSFLASAYRRPARDEEIDRIAKLIAIRRGGGRSSVDAYADGLKAALCSPSFLYLEERGDQRLDSYSLATRLSYFLSGTTPDDELLRLAAEDRLPDDAVLSGQVRRLLKDRRADAFVAGFLDSWLTLRDLGSSPPDRRSFPAYYHYDLLSAMRRETELFTKHLIDENASVFNYLDADFTFVNKPLARLYGLKPPPDRGFQRVQLTDRRRGGLLGQASVLTVTANGIDTSPVVRGVWLLDNILGSPPSPPPPDVEPLDPDIRGAKTIRDQLKRHREIATCNDCHRKIDPLGFALENFDPIGGWRTSYGQQKPIDASGQLPSGKSFSGVEELKQILRRDRSDQFARALVQKLLAYAMGRQLELPDRQHVDTLVKRLHERGDGMRDLIELVALSDLFRSP